MKKNRIISSIAAAALVSALAFGAFGCAPNEEKDPSEEGLTGGVAATVNGTEIEEDTITRAINNMRASYQMDDEEQWVQYLTSYGDTVESVRYQTIGTYVNRELVLQCADQLGVTTDDAEIQSYVEKMSSQYSSNEAWLNAVEEAGWENEDAYRDQLRYSILSKKITDQKKEEAEASFDDAALLAAVQEKASTYDGAKRTAHITFANTDQETADKVLADLRAGAISWADAVEQYSTDEDTKANGGDMGWDKLEDLDSDYTSAISEVEKGGFSEVTSVKNNLEIITVTDVWTAPENITSTSQLPEEFVADIRTDTIDEKANDAVESWLADRHGDNDVQVNPMPDGLPYWVDLSEKYSAEEMEDINEKALYKVIHGVEKTEEETTEAEAEAGTEGAAEGETPAEGDASTEGGAPSEGENSPEGETPSGENAPAEGETPAEEGAPAEGESSN